MRKKYYTLLATLLLCLAGGALNAQYCTSNLYITGCTDGDNIESFSTAGGTTNITNLQTGCSNAATGYTYFSTQTYTGLQGTTVNFKIVNNEDYDEYYKIFVDWNSDSDFADGGETVYTTTILAGDSVSGTFPIPVTATAGTKRLRVRAVFDPTPFTACSQEDYGEIEDYNLEVVAAAPCSGTPVPGTAIASTTAACSGMPFGLTLTGTTAASGLTVQWQSRPAGGTTWTNITGATTTIYTVGNQTAATEYQAVVSCGASSATSNIVLVSQNPFTACYCSPNNGTTLASLSGENDITNVSISGTTLNYATASTSADGYTQVPATATGGTATLTPGNTYTVTAAISTWSLDVDMWIDYNQDGTFGTGELVSLTINTANTAATGTFTVPATALNGQTGMRIMVSEWDPIAGPCTDLVVGEAEDYIVTIGSSAPCPAPSPLTVTAVTATGATVTWAATTGATGYEYVINQSSGAPTGAGTAITGTSHTVTGLTPSTLYYAHVRSSCSPGSFSAWTTQSFTTASSGPCSVPTSINASALGSTTATISWNAVAGALGYEYQVSTTSSLPAGAGTPTVTNNVGLTSLLPSTVYYFHLRTSCNGGNFSNWTTYTFATTVTSVTDADGEKGLNIYPNPVSGTLTINNPAYGTGTALISVADLTGKTVHTVKAESAEIRLDLQPLPAGVYILRYEFGDQRTHLRFTKQ